MNKIDNKRKRKAYPNVTDHNFIVIVPKCKLYETMFNYTIIDWDSYKVTCVELLAVLKAFQFQQTNGLEWFWPNEQILDSYIPEWRTFLIELVKLKIVEVNPHNGKLNFGDNRTRYHILLINRKFKERLKRLEEVLVQINFQQYNASLKKKNQNRLKLKSNNFKN